MKFTLQGGRGGRRFDRHTTGEKEEGVELQNTSSVTDKCFS